MYDHVPGFFGRFYIVHRCYIFIRSANNDLNKFVVDFQR